MSPGSINNIKVAAVDCGFSIDESKSGSFDLVFLKNDLRFNIIVPVNVLEWFFEVEDVEQGIKSHDWFDYYDNKSDDEMFLEMECDILKVIQELPSFEYRLRTTKSDTYCERYEFDEKYQIGNWRGFSVI